MIGLLVLYMILVLSSLGYYGANRNFLIFAFPITALFAVVALAGAWA